MLVKICGIDNPKIVKAVLNMGADFLGVVFTPTSKRFLGIKKAMAIVEAIKKENSKPILIFRNEPFEIIKPIVERIGNCIVQFQGQRHPEVKRIIKEFEAIVVFSANGFSKSLVEEVFAESAVFNQSSQISSSFIRQKIPSLMIDGQEPGSGKTFCWERFNPPNFPWFLAGGLKVSNLHQAIIQLEPTGVDVSSGVENSKGKKDLHLIDAFIQAAKRKN